MQSEQYCMQKFEKNEFSSQSRRERERERGWEGKLVSIYCQAIFDFCILFECCLSPNMQIYSVFASYQSGPCVAVFFSFWNSCVVLRKAIMNTELRCKCGFCRKFPRLLCIERGRTSFVVFVTKNIFKIFNIYQFSKCLPI